MAIGDKKWWCDLEFGTRMSTGAIDESMNPVNIPQFVPESDEEKEMWNKAKLARDAMRK